MFDTLPDLGVVSGIGMGETLRTVNSLIFFRSAASLREKLLYLYLANSGSSKKISLSGMLPLASSETVPSGSSYLSVNYERFIGRRA